MLNIFTATVTPFGQNARVLHCDSTNDLVGIDPGGDVELIKNTFPPEATTLRQIWLTHSHIDHVGGVKKLKEDTGAELLGHRVESEFRSHVRAVSKMYGLPEHLFDNCPEPDQYIDGGGKLSCGNYEFEILFTPGHSPGHLCFYCASENVLIAGDALFAGSIGRTDLPGGDHELLLRSIRERILSLPDETRVLSGHGPDTTVGVERRTNPFLQGL